MTKQIDNEQLLELLERGLSPPEIAKEVKVTPPTIRNRIAKLQQEQGVLLQYRSLQNLRLTELQHAILEAITPDKIAEAPLKDLVTSFKILKDKELVMTGNPTEIKGLVGYLVQLEKEELAAADIIEPEEHTVPEEDADLPKLGGIQ